MESLFKRFWWLAVHMWKLNHIKLLVCGHMWMNFSVYKIFCPHWCVSVITSVCVCLKFELTNLTGRQDFTYTKPLWKCASVRMMESRGLFFFYFFCTFKQLLVLVEMKQIKKSRESAHSNLRAHIPTFTILQKKEPCDTRDTKQFRSSVGGCTAAAATWRHPESHVLSPRFWCDCNKCFAVV